MAPFIKSLLEKVCAARPLAIGALRARALRALDSQTKQIPTMASVGSAAGAALTRACHPTPPAEQGQGRQGEGADAG